MNARVKAIILHIIGLLVCVVPPALATAEYFPIISAEPRKQISAFGVVLIAICCVPFWRSIKAFLRSPSAWKVWLVILIIFCAARSIADELIIISMIGLPAGLIGGAIFWIERRYRIKHALLRLGGASDE